MSKFKSNNVLPPPNMKERYEAAYNKLFNELTPEIQERVKGLFEDPNSRDFEANNFIRAVIKLAESDEEI